MQDRYSIKLKDRKEIASSTMAFYFTKSNDFNFIAGQHVTMYQPNISDNSRIFCVASAPYEDDLIFAMRMRDSAFKNALKLMPIGGEVTITKPRGPFVLHDDTSKPAVFLVGGIGITPFRSMALQSAHDNSPRKIFLFYSNRTRQDAAFFDELNDLEKKNSNYKFIATMTDEVWPGERGYINREMLERCVEDVKIPVYYIAGPEGFVRAMRGMLQSLKINSDNIKTDEFSGY
jgi:ferredoxin-NADP reductase